MPNPERSFGFENLFEIMHPLDMDELPCYFSFASTNGNLVANILEMKRRAAEPQDSPALDGRGLKGGWPSPCKEPSF